LEVDILFYNYTYNENKIATESITVGLSLFHAEPTLQHTYRCALYLIE